MKTFPQFLLQNICVFVEGIQIMLDLFIRLEDKNHYLLINRKYIMHQFQLGVF